MNIKKVAEKAGVSITTVSRVMNSSEKVSESTRKKVMDAVKELNYTPNWFARNLHNDRSNVIGLLIPDMLEQSNMELARGVEKVARQKECNIILCNTEYKKTLEEQTIKTLIERNIDGLILMSSALSEQELRELHSQKLRFVLIDRPDCAETENVVCTNYEEAAEEAVDYFFSLGRKRIAIIVADRAEYIGKNKENGYRKSLEKHGVDVDDSLIIKGEDTIQGGMVAAGKLLEMKNRPDAIFAATDTMAFGVIERIRQEGLTIEDVGVIGFDDIQTGAVMEPKLTTVTKPSYRMGLTAARILFDIIEEEEITEQPQSIVLQSRLKIRKSCGNKERIREIW